MRNEKSFVGDFNAKKILSITFQVQVHRAHKEEFSKSGPYAPFSEFV